MMNMQAGIPKAQLMAGDAMNRALTRMAHEMMEQLMPLENVVLVGILLYALLGKLADAVVRAIEKGQDDGSAQLNRY